MKDLMRRRPMLVLGFAIAAVLACIAWVIFIVGRGLPPRTVVMTTGPEGSAYRKFGERYRAALARNGIDLKLEPSAGNVENLARRGSAPGIRQTRSPEISRVSARRSRGPAPRPHARASSTT